MTYTVLYDHNCPLCRQAVHRLQTWDRDGVLAYLPGGDDETRRRFPGISEAALADALHLVSPDGNVWAGAEAVEKLVDLLPGWRRARWLFRIPLARPVAAWMYRRMSAARFRLSCRDHCRSES
jgi:predicted DCC family thiol-disulfide oxidoreductase YuxK